MISCRSIIFYILQRLGPIYSNAFAINSGSKESPCMKNNMISRSKTIWER